MADAHEHHEHKAPPSHGGQTVDIFGKKVKKSTALVGGVAAVGVIIIAVMRKRAAAQAAAQQAASSASGLVTDPAGNQCATLDAATGYCPGTSQDVAAQQAATSGAAVGSADEGGLAGGGYYYEPTATGTSSTGSAIPTFTTNASWAQYVETALGSNGADPVAAAIAKYLSGQPVTTDQQTTIEEAIAIANFPPVTGANGNPPGMTLSASTTAASTTASTTAAGSTTATTAAATGSTTAAASTTAASTTASTPATAAASSSTAAPQAPQTSPPNIAGKANGRQIVITWGSVGGATGYQIQVAQPGGALILNKNLTATSAVIDIAPVLGTYDFKIRALNQNTPGPWSAVKQVTVTQ